MRRNRKGDQPNKGSTWASSARGWFHRNSNVKSMPNQAFLRPFRKTLVLPPTQKNEACPQPKRMRRNRRNCQLRLVLADRARGRGDSGRLLLQFADCETVPEVSDSSIKKFSHKLRIKV